MQTWKDVFRRKEELQNLKNIGFCFLIVVALITGFYALTGLRDIFQGLACGAYRVGNNRNARRH